MPAMQLSEVLHTNGIDRTQPCIVILPRNWETAADQAQYIYEDASITLSKLLKEALPSVRIAPLTSTKRGYIQENAFQLILPTIFISLALISQNPTAVSIAIGVISNYIHDFFRGIAGKKKVRIHLVRERTSAGDKVEFDYEGDPGNVPSVEKIIKSLRL